MPGLDLAFCGSQQDVVLTSNLTHNSIALYSVPV